MSLDVSELPGLGLGLGLVTQAVTQGSKLIRAGGVALQCPGQINNGSRSNSMLKSH